MNKLTERIFDINKRKAEIRDLIEKGDKETKLDDLDKELKSLNAEEQDIEKRIKFADGIVINKPKEDKIDDRSFGIDSKEYRSAYLKTLQRRNDLTDVEKRALTTAADSAGAAIPTTTLNKVIDRIQQTSALFPLINVSYVKGNLHLVVAGAKNAAAWTSEGAAITATDDKPTSVDLTGYQLVKAVNLSAGVESMSIDAFEKYIADEIGRQLAIAIENAILNGTGTGMPTGILAGTFNTSNSATFPNTGIDYDSIMDTLALLPSGYHNNAKFTMNRKMLFGGVRKIKDANKMPIFCYNAQDQAAMSILGYPVVLDDQMPDDTILLGDFSQYYMNFSKAPTIDIDNSVGFLSATICYRGLAIADGKPAIGEAFVKLTKAAA